MTKERKEIFDSFPLATKGWLEAKKELDNIIQELTIKYSKDLAEFKLNLAEKESRKWENAGRSGKRGHSYRGQKGHRGYKGYRGKYRPY